MILYILKIPEDWLFEIHHFLLILPEGIVGQQLFFSRNRFAWFLILPKKEKRKKVEEAGLGVVGKRSRVVRSSVSADKNARGHIGAAGVWFSPASYMGDDTRAREGSPGRPINGRGQRGTRHGKYKNRARTVPRVSVSPSIPCYICLFGITYREVTTADHTRQCQYLSIPASDSFQLISCTHRSGSSIRPLPLHPTSLI